MYKIKIIFLAVFLMSTMIACKKTIDLQPTDTFTEEKAYLTIDDLQRGLNTAYGRFSPESYSIPSSTCSDEMKFGADNAGQFQFEYRLQYNSDVTSGGSTLSSWSSMYTVIDQVNRVLAVMDGITAPNAAEDARKNIIKGQLLTLRALSHYHLLTLYSKRYDAADPLGVPVMTTSNLLATPARNTVAQTVAASESDLTTAKPLLGAAPSAAAFDDKFINAITVDAIAARVALYKGDWNTAETLAGNVIASNVRPLATGANFNGIWTDAVTNAEVLLRLRRGGQSLGANYTTSGGAVYMSPSDKLNNIYAATDIRKAAYIGTLSSKRVVNKYFTSAAGARINDIKAIRIAEMYLIRAEARASKASPDLAGATADINTLRGQRITGYVAVPTFGSQTAAISEIMERNGYEQIGKRCR
jgi:starch-binding outer membrane protein, SusD/RagB family